MIVIITDEKKNKKGSTCTPAAAMNRQPQFPVRSQEKIGNAHIAPLWLCLTYIIRLVLLTVS